MYAIPKLPTEGLSGNAHQRRKQRRYRRRETRRILEARQKVQRNAQPLIRAKAIK